MAVARLSVSPPAPTPTRRREPHRRGRALPAHVLHAAALQRRDAPARARVLAHGDGLLAAPAGRQRRARPRRLHLRDPPPARRRSSRSAIVVMGQEAAVFARAGIGPLEQLGRGRGAGAAAALVRQRRRGARGAARVGVRRRRPRPDARRLPDRVEQDPPAHAGRRLAAARGRRRPRRARRRSAARPTTGRGWPTPGATRFEERMQAIAERGQVDAPAHARRHRRSATSA